MKGAAAHGAGTDAGVRRARDARGRPGRAAGAAAVALLAASLAACSGTADGTVSGGGDDGRPLVVRGGTLIDGTGEPPVEGAVVVARAGTIRAAGPAERVEIPADARVVDARGKWIVPGLIDAHVHYSQTGWVDGRPDAVDLRNRYPYPEVVSRLQSHPERFFRSYLCSGVTATFDVGGYPWTRDLQARGERDPGAPRVAAAGALLSTVDFWLNLPDQRQFVYMSGDSIVRRTVRSHARLASAAIKVWFITPPQPPDSARASRLVSVADEEAEKFGLPLIVHATGLWEAKEAIRSGAEVLVHSVFDEPVDEEFLTLARENDVVYTTTVTVLEGYRNVYRSGVPGAFPYPTGCVDSATVRRVRAGIPAAKRPEWARGPEREPPEVPAMGTTLDNLARVDSAGVTVAMGTDAGNPGTLHGPSVYREMELLARAGLTPMEVLVASTRNAARAMGRGEDLGTVEPGKLADLLVLDRNPLDSVANYAAVSRVVKGGGVAWPPDGGR